MLKRFYPSKHYQTIFNIPYEELWKQGYKGIMYDIDNTLVPFDAPHPTNEVIELFTKLRDMGFKICLVSNNNHNRVLRFNEKLKVFAVAKALKPMRRNLRKAMELMGTDSSNTILIGDQMFTDVWGGNRLGLKTFLVMPIQVKEQWITKIKRGTEKLVFKKYLKASGGSDDAKN